MASFILFFSLLSVSIYLTSLCRLWNKKKVQKNAISTQPVSKHNFLCLLQCIHSIVCYNFWYSHVRAETVSWTCNLSLISLESYLVMYIFMICSSINKSVIWVFVDVEQQLWFVLSQMVEIEVSDLKVEDVQTWQDICVLYVMTEILSSLLHRWL